MITNENTSPAYLYFYPEHGALVYESDVDALADGAIPVTNVPVDLVPTYITDILEHLEVLTEQVAELTVAIDTRTCAYPQSPPGEDLPPTSVYEGDPEYPQEN